MSRRRTVFILLLAGLAIGLLLVSARLDEPSYRGRSLSDWLEALVQREDAEGAAEARLALRQMGTNALPHLLSMLRTKDSRFKKLLQQWEGKHSFVDFRLYSADVIRGRAAEGIVAIGPPAAPWIPALTNLLDEPDLGETALWALSGVGPEALPILLASLNHSNSALRRAAMYSLNGFTGGDRKLICTALVNATNNSDSAVRRMAYRTLGRMTNEWEIALPVIISGLHDLDFQVARGCLLNVGNFGSNALTAVPLLITALDDRRSYHLAARSLRAVDPRAALSAHAGNLQSTNGWKRVAAAVSLRELGPEAADAVPLLLKGFSDPDEDVKGSCAVALLKIDPEAAAKAGIDASRYPSGRRGRLSPR